MNQIDTNQARTLADGLDNIAPTTLQGQQAWQYAQSDNFFSPEEQTAVMRRQLEPYRAQIESQLAAVGQPPQHFAQYPHNEEALYNGQQTGLVKINLAPGIQMEGRLRIVMTEAGPDLRFTPVQRQLTIPDEVGGIVLTKGEKKQLAEEGSLSQPVLTVKDNRYVPTYLQIDPETNTVELRRLKAEALPTKLMGIDLTRDQQMQLVNGHPVRLMGLIDQQGEPFNATVKASSAKQALGFSDFSRQDVSLKPDQSHRHQVIQNNEGGKTDLIRSRETATGLPVVTHQQAEAIKDFLEKEPGGPEQSTRIRR